jgi:ribonuclease HI
MAMSSAENSDELLIVFTDGACSGNPGPGGWAWAVENGPQGSGSERASTNQRMEVWAVLDALQTFLPAFPGSVRIVSDSTYVVNCFRDRWWQGWIARGWKNSQKQPVANQDLWKPLVALYRDAMEMGPERVTFRWVKGHSGHPMNDRVDALAVAAARSQSPRTTTALPRFAMPATPHAAMVGPDSGPALSTQAASGDDGDPLRLF